MSEVQINNRLDAVPVGLFNSGRIENEAVKTKSPSSDDENNATVAKGSTSAATATDKTNKAIESKAEKVEQQEKQAEKLTSPQLEQVAKQLQDFVGGMNKGLEFLVDEDSGRDVIKVIDRNSGDLVKQFPSEEVLSMVAKLSEATGNFVNSKA
jgi:flagellar protein FlaG